MTTASVFLSLSITSAEVTAAAAADAAGAKIGNDPQGLLVAAQEDVRAAKRKLTIVSGIIGGGTEKTAIDNMITALT